MGTTLSYLTTLFGTTTNATGPPACWPRFTDRPGNRRIRSARTQSRRLQAAQKNQAQDIKITAQQPEVQRAVNAFTAAIGSAKTVKQLLANPAVMRVLLRLTDSPTRSHTPRWRKRRYSPMRATRSHWPIN